MSLIEKDVYIETEGMGIVMYSPETVKGIPEGYYHITLLTGKPASGTWGDNQIIYVYLNKLTAMPELTWHGVPELFTD